MSYNSNDMNGSVDAWLNMFVAIVEESIEHYETIISRANNSNVSFS